MLRATVVPGDETPGGALQVWDFWRRRRDSNP